MSKEDRYSHLGGNPPGGTGEGSIGEPEAPDDAVHVTVSDGSGDLHLRLDGDVPTEAVVEAIRRCGDDEPTPPWAYGMRTSTRATRSMLAAGTFGMRLGAIGTGSMLSPWRNADDE